MLKNVEERKITRPGPLDVWISPRRASQPGDGCRVQVPTFQGVGLGRITRMEVAIGYLKEADVAAMIEVLSAD